MENLEIKHLIPYLPYKLKLWSIVYERTLKFEGVEYIGDDDLFIVLCDHNIMVSSDSVKPILISMDRLIIEYDSNGDYCGKMNELYDLYINYLYLGYKKEKNICFTIKDLYHLILHEPQFIPYNVLNKLLEWHFDLFNLIDKGLALADIIILDSK